MSPRPVVLSVAALALASAGFLSPDLARPAAAFAGGNGRIVFVGGPPDALATEIISSRPDGTGVKRLTDNDSLDQAPAWSPDGSRIAWVHASGALATQGNTEIWVMNADGSGKTQVTDNAEAENTPAWSPDGTRLAYERSAAGDVSDIWTIKVDGSDERRLTTTGKETRPAWSPDGSRIGFISQRGGTGGYIYTITPAGTGEAALTPVKTGPAYDLAWAPDGKQIAFSNGDIFTVPATGGRPTQVTRTPQSLEYDVAWSPDGTRFIATRRSVVDGSARIWTMRRDGTGQTKLSFPGMAADAADPDWQPKVDPLLQVPKPLRNDLIVFTSDRVTPTNPDGDQEVFSMTVAGTKVTQLTSNKDTPDIDASWSPDGRHIVFSRRINDGSGRYNIFTMGADGSGVRRLTTARAQDRWPAWSSAGRIAWTRTDAQGSSDIWTMHVDGTHQQAVTSGTDIQERPSWSPDGDRIAYDVHAASGQSVADIHVMSAEGSGDLEIVHGSAQPAWGPTDLIAQTRLSGTPRTIAISQSDGTFVRDATSGEVTYPAWAPDGSWLVIVRRTSAAAGYDLFLVKADGSVVVNLSKRAGSDDLHPSWTAR